MSKLKKVEKSVNTVGSKVKENKEEQDKRIKTLEKRYNSFVKRLKTSLIALGIALIFISYFADFIFYKITWYHSQGFGSRQGWGILIGLGIVVGTHWWAVVWGIMYLGKRK